MRLSDIPLRQMRRIKPTLLRDCPRCGDDRVMQLPAEPAGLARCTSCGTRLDLCDAEPDERRDYLACYEPDV